MATNKATVKAVATPKRYWAFEEMSLDGGGPGYDSPEEAALEDGAVDGDSVVIYELVKVGTFKLSSKPTLTPIK